MRDLYHFDGEYYINCSEVVLSDLLDLCEDNEAMKEAITSYFRDVKGIDEV